MTKIASSFIAIAMLTFVPLRAEAVQATAPRTWVSHSGNDSNACTALSPCLTFAGAYAKTSAGGEIDVLDGGDFGYVQINHALTIANDGAGTAAITPANLGAINISAGLSDAVVLRGLTFNGVTGSGGAAISYTGGASLLIDHCKIQGFQSGGGIYVASTSSGVPLKLSVTDTVLSNDGASAAGAGVLVVSAVGGTATAHLERVQILNAIGNGIRADGTFSGAGAIDVELHDVTVDAANGGSGVVAVSPTSGGPAVKLVADNVTVSHSAGYGFRAVGGTASVTLRHSTIEANGVGIGASSGGQIFSFGDNSFAGNTSGNGATPTAIPPE
jgi:hypothetical protein